MPSAADRAPRPFEPARLGDGVAIAQPQSQRSLDACENGLLVGFAGGMRQDDLVRVVAVAGLDHLMSANQVHAIRRHPMVLHERVLFDDVLDFGLGLRL